MSLGSVLALIQTASELGLISALTVIALYLSYSMLNVCDLSTDGCFTLGATVGAVVTLSGHPFLALPAAMAAGIASGFITAFLQTKMGVNSLLAGIIVNTALYSINIAVMGNSSILNLNKTDTVFTKALDLLRNTPLMEQYRWGTNLPYMLAGANSIPQKEVMDWVINRVYSFNSIVRALENRKNNTVDNAKYPTFEATNKYKKVIVVGGGNSVKEHL